MSNKTQTRTKCNMRSVEDQVHLAPTDAAGDEHRGVRKLGSRIVARFRRAGLSADLRELRGRTASALDLAGSVGRYKKGPCNLPRCKKRLDGSGE